RPVSSKICVIPTLRPSNPIAIARAPCGLLPERCVQPKKAAANYLPRLPLHKAWLGGRCIRMRLLLNDLTPAKKLAAY
ncbi:MAG TPA: hypothetical protein VIK18_10520, partial [Pirellulales bacterium]